MMTGSSPRGGSGGSLFVVFVLAGKLVACQHSLFAWWGQRGGQALLTALM